MRGSISKVVEDNTDGNLYIWVKYEDGWRLYNFDKREWYNLRSYLHCNPDTVNVITDMEVYSNA